MTANLVVMIGAFPPPVGGAAKNNKLLLDSLQTAGVEVMKLDTAADSLSHRRSLAYHSRRIRRNLAALVRTLAAGKPTSFLYHVPDAGAGAWYSWAHITLAAQSYGCVILHHRTFRYIDRRSWPMALITRAKRKRTTHVFLSAGMAEAFQRRYGPVVHLIASNARFVAQEAAAHPPSRRPGPLRLGHLSNLCREKGFFDVAASFEMVRSAGIEAELHLAGPVIEPEVEHRLEQLRGAHHDAIVHTGQISGAAKRDFYRQIDLFLFPTRFEQEAAPNVVYESLAAGIPVLAFDRGCLPEMLADGRGEVCPRGEDFGRFTLDYLRDFLFDDDSRMERARMIKRLVRDESKQSCAQYARLMEILGAGTDSRVAQEYL